MPPAITCIEHALEARGVSKYFGDVPALLGVSVRIERGHAALVYGPNGAGKSTLLRLLASLSSPSEGEIILDGLRLTQNPEVSKAKTGFVSHATFLYGDLSVYENLELAGKLFGVPQLRERIELVISAFSLRDRARQLVRSLSRGLQQRATLARALLHDPDFLLLDEPFTGLDAESAAHLGELIRQLPRQGKAVIFSTHGFSEGSALANRLLALDRGRLRYDGPVADAPLAALGIERPEESLRN